MQTYGQIIATDVQLKSSEMDGTELYENEQYIPSFSESVKKKNMKERKAGKTDGFVCRSTAGRVVRLIQNYDSDTYIQEPEELPAQWAFYWSKDPKKALPFVEMATSPYMTGDCCTYEGHVWQSGQDTNTWAPGSVGVKWTDLGTIEEIIGGGTVNVSLY